MSNYHFKAPPMAIHLREDNGVSEIQILRQGKFNHPFYGKFDINKEVLTSMVKNFEDHTRGCDLAIDYDHKVEDAAGWITKLYTKNEDSELWAEVKWTPRGKKSLDDREYRYISADFALEYEDPESKDEFGPILFGAALTNRPFVKNMAPAIELNELNQSKGDNQMNVEQLKEENKQLTEQLAVKKDEVKRLKDEMKDATSLSEENQKLKDKIKELEEKLSGFQKDKELSEKKGQFQKLLSEGKAVAAQEEAFIAGDTVKFAELAGQMNREESGAADPGESINQKEDAADKVARLAEEKVQKGEASDFGSAQSMVLSENPELKKEIYGE